MESTVNKMTNHKYVQLLQAQLKQQVVLSDIASYWTLVDVVHAQNDGKINHLSNQFLVALFSYLDFTDLRD